MNIRSDGSTSLPPKADPSFGGELWKSTMILDSPLYLNGLGGSRTHICKADNILSVARIPFRH